MRARSFEVLDAAYAAGVRYLDAARSYGRAEEFLGAWLDDARGPRDVVVGSKWGYVYTADWEVAADPPEVKHHDADTLRRQLAETRERLGDRLDLYQIHSATPDSGVLENAEVLGELAGPARERRRDRRLGERDLAGRHDRPRRRARAASTRSRRPGTCTSARPARRWARPRRGPGRDRQGGARQRPPRPARARCGARGGRARARLDARRRRARRRARPAVRRRRAQRRRHARHARQQPRRRASWRSPTRCSRRWRRSRRTATSTGARAPRCPGTELSGAPGGRRARRRPGCGGGRRASR